MSLFVERQPIVCRTSANRPSNVRQSFGVRRTMQYCLSVTLTLYVARHSWATIAKNSGVPTALISDAMGHSSEKMTQIYLDSIDAGRIDKANREIISHLFR